MVFIVPWDPTSADMLVWETVAVLIEMIEVMPSNQDPHHWGLLSLKTRHFKILH